MKPLTRLLQPKSLVVVGGREAEEVIRQCDKLGFSGPIWDVNPKRETLAGRTCLRSLDDLPQIPDAAFVAVPRLPLIETIGKLADMGVGGAVCYASGFSELDGEGAALERQLVAASGAMALTGPNTYGHINYLDGAALWPDQQGSVRVTRGVAIVTQSGNIACNLTQQQRAMPLAYLVTVGNKAKGDLADYVEAFLDDPRVSAIGLHIEGLEDIPAFARAAERARQCGVPVVALKTGRSTVGAQLTLSHTSSFAGPDRLYDALFDRLGIARAQDVGVFLETLKLLHLYGPLPGTRISSMSCSGGEASLVADLAEDFGLETPPLQPEAAQALAAVLGPKVPLANPLDYHTYIWGDAPQLTACFSAMLGGGFDMNLLILDFPRADRCDGATWQAACTALIAARKATGARAAILASLAECLPESIGLELMAADIVPLMGLRDGLQAVALAAKIGMAWERPLPLPLHSVKGRGAAFLRLLTEHAAKAALAAYGLAVPAGEIVPISDAGAAAARLGFPVVVKTSSETLAHKSDAGGVVLNVQSVAAAQTAAQSMAALGPLVLVEKMATGAVAELIVGVTHDPQFGLALVIGAGGVLVELIEDSATVLLPAPASDIERAVRGLKIMKLMEGYRGKPAGDLAALVAAISAIAAYAEAHRDHLVELDVNPLLVLPKGVVAVDALIREIADV